jgi:hypothetical protein
MSSGSELGTDDEDPLDVEMSGSRGKPEGVAIVLDKAATLMEQMPEGTRYDFKLEIQEVDA